MKQAYLATVKLVGSNVLYKYTGDCIKNLPLRGCESVEDVEGKTDCMSNIKIIAGNNSTIN